MLFVINRCYSSIIISEVKKLSVREDIKFTITDENGPEEMFLCEVSLGKSEIKNKQKRPSYQDVKIKSNGDNGYIIIEETVFGNKPEKPVVKEITKKNYIYSKTKNNNFLVEAGSLDDILLLFEM